MMTSMLRVGGLVLAPTVWALNTQLGQILPYPDCHTGSHWSAIASFAAALLALGSGLAPHLVDRGVESRMRLFTRYVGSLAALAFAFALALQGTASLLLGPCAR